MGVFRHRIGIKEEKKGAVKVPLPVRKVVLVSRGCWMASVLGASLL